MLARVINAIGIRIGGALAAATARRSSQDRLARIAPRRVLVICYGNIYRSAFVGELLRNELPASVEVKSAGFHPVVGRSCPERHIEISQRYGVSLQEHRSSVVTAQDVEWADLIVLMDRHNWAALKRLGARPDKLIWLGGLGPGPVEISDPYELGDTQAERVVARMKEMGTRLSAAIKSSRSRS